MVSNERRLNMRTIGIDLAVTATHKAVVVDDTGQFVTPVLSFRSRWEEIAHLVARAREGVEADHPLQAVMEPTGMAWFNIAVPLSRLGITVYLVNGRKVAALRRYYKQHAGSDRISARVLAKLPLVDAESLYPLAIPTPGYWTPTASPGQDWSRCCPTRSVPPPGSSARTGTTQHA
jgi:hypothetical protein